MVFECYYEASNGGRRVKYDLSLDRKAVLAALYLFLGKSPSSLAGRAVVLLTAYGCYKELINIVKNTRI